MGFPELAGQAKSQLDERHRGARLPAAQQDVATHINEIGDQVVIPGGRRDRQCLIAVPFGGRVAARLLEQVGRGGQAPGAQHRRLLCGWDI